MAPFRHSKRTEASVITPVSHGIDIIRTIRGTSPAIPFEKMAREILGSTYSLSLVICADSLARRLHRTYKTDQRRHKTYSPNVLSFPIAKSEGEIFLNVRKAAREARELNIKPGSRIAHLFVHGCFHLAGQKHGEKMEASEMRILRLFGFGK